MKELIEEIEKKIKTKEDLIFFLEQVDLAHVLILKNIKKSVSETLKEKIDPTLVSVLEKIERESEELEKEKAEREKKELLKKEKETQENLNRILEKEKELEERVREIEAKEAKAKGTAKEKEIEKERWELEEERIKSEREKWELKEGLQKIKENLKKIKPIKKERDVNQLLFFLEILRDDLISLPQVDLQIAFDPSPETVSKISDWFEENLKKKVILNFKINPKIVGGAKVGYEGRVLNFSLIEEIKKELKK